VVKGNQESLKSLIEKKLTEPTLGGPRGATPGMMEYKTVPAGSAAKGKKSGAPAATRVILTPTEHGAKFF
jgi:hypothetical protein